MKAIAEVQRVMAEKQRLGGVPTRSMLDEVTQQLRRNSERIKTAISDYEATFGTLRRDEVSTIEKAVDELTGALVRETTVIPAPADASWVKAISTRLQRTSPLPVGEGIPATVELVDADKVDLEVLGEFETQFVAGDDQTRQAIEEGTSWIAKTRNVSLEVARLSLLTLIYLQLTIALGILLVVEPEITGFALAATGVNAKDMTRSIAKFAEGNRDE